MIAETPTLRCYAVIFTSILNPEHIGYAETALRMEILASRVDGFLGLEAARQEIGITVSYWSSLDAIERWRSDLEHREAQRIGRERWYRDFRIRIARVERDVSG